MRTGLAAQLQKYGEALELLWFQYVVGYDKQEQRSLAASLHNQVFDYGRMITNMLDMAQNYLSGNVVPVAVGVIAFALVIFLAFFGKRFLRWTRGGVVAAADGRTLSSVQFYERLIVSNGATWCLAR